MTRIPDFSDLPLFDGASAGAKDPFQSEPWTTPEGIDVKPVYGPNDLDGIDHLSTMPGFKFQ